MSLQIFPKEEEPLCLPKGFRWSAVEANIRYAGRPDLALIDGGPGTVAAAVFTQNAFAAAPVQVSRRLLHEYKGRTRGVVVNAGCANAATGLAGLRAAQEMAERAARIVAGNVQETFLVCSTGTIGVHLPMEKVLPAIEHAAAKLVDTDAAFRSVARAIMTTDTRPKYISAEIESPQGKFRIAACAKGSGMIYPRMATLLAFVATDAKVNPSLLEHCFKEAIDHSLNCLTVDGDTSTNDTAIILANGASGVEIEETNVQAVSFFTAAVRAALEKLTMQLARDGEGATKLIEVNVLGARSYAEAKQVALAIANSNLVKTAIHGCDANWGRIACAIGNSGVPVEPERVRIAIGDLLLFANGAPVTFSEERALEILREEVVRICVDLGLGKETAKAWTCDLSAKYVEINGAYRT
ncbi:MAG: bifunctional glutamate N-acetyltransferase/amino-acid acetyltransferase ArgJ [Candidatus Sumerlaeaceae bacterium]|nr:bifunctional glutamate N-acetyltransferase/amino-acid acetyltransferase ArgJ [Candidatus Sumerlaeaceae bacterium]